MIPATVMTWDDWHRDIEPHTHLRDAWYAWLHSCGIDADHTLSVSLTEGAVVFSVDNGAYWPPSRGHRPLDGDVALALFELEVVVPNAPLPPIWHTRRHAIAEEPA